MTQNTGWGGHEGGWGGTPQWGGWAPPAPQPGVIPLRPLALGEILGGSFSTIRRHWKQLAGVMLAVQAIVLPVMALATGIAVAAVYQHIEPVFDPPFGTQPTAEHVVPVLVAGGTLFVLLLLTGGLGVAVLTAVCPAVLKEAVMGRPTTFRAMWRAALRRTPAVAGTMLLTLLIAGSPLLAVMAVWLPLMFSAASGDVSPAMLALLPVFLLVAVPVMVWLSTRFALAPAVVVLEGARPVTALRRSAKLVRGEWWRIFGITMLGGLIAAAVSYLIQLPFNIIGMFGVIPAAADQPEGSGPTSGMITALVVAFVAMLLGGAVSQMFQIGFTQLVSGVLYVDQRIRREGLADAILAELAANAPNPGPAPTAPSPAPASPPPSQPEEPTDT
ncbi:hypothetical protein [Streptomyces sp. KS 21]|uniref:hypothetical protein n=1 Tax=Streptomyces sp. KS 21 TaxID=2485150 RepID=UPI001063030A|nr:hypothetical protein [Streptomyces sp. KS 21]TDU80201.1 hypothetical protein EDD91_7035 [Streptomyces sp. KS 21]